MFTIHRTVWVYPLNPQSEKNVMKKSARMQRYQTGRSEQTQIFTYKKPNAVGCCGVDEATGQDDRFQQVVQKLTDINICRAVRNNSKYSKASVDEAKRRGLTCGVGETSTTRTASSATSQSNTPTSAELLAAQRKADELEQQIAALKAEQEQQEQSVSNDTKLPTITIASATTTGAQGIIRGRVNDNTGIAELRVDGQKIAVDSNGNFSATTYVPEGGASVNIEAIDLAGLSSTMSVRVDRACLQTASISFDRLNPLSAKRSQTKMRLLLSLV